jgi:general secretion pathway protein E
LHTNDSFGAVTRLVDMGIEPFLVSSSILAVIAQRLVRLLCKQCREPFQPTAEELARIGHHPADIPGQIYRAAANGCKACRGTGYRGRTSIHELMMVDDEVRSLVMKNADAASIRRACTSRGMRLLRQDGADRIVEGHTTIEELLTVTQEEID